METIIGVLAVMGVVLSFMVLVLSVKLSRLNENHKGLVNEFNILKSFTIQRINKLNSFCDIKYPYGYPTRADQTELNESSFYDNKVIVSLAKDLKYNINLIEDYLGIELKRKEIIDPKYVKKPEPAETTNA